jgi:hypothetical protein
MEKFPSSILIVALNPYLQLDNQQFYRHVLADELRKRTGAVDTGFLRNSLSFVTIPSSITTTLLKINILFKYPSDAFADKYSRVNILEFMLIWLVVRTSSLRGLQKTPTGSAPSSLSCLSVQRSKRRQFETRSAVK